MTITEFLLARIAEDEAEARRVVAMYPGATIHAMGPVINKAEMALTIGGTRVLAECEAKRRIVELHAEGRRGCSTCLSYRAGYQEDWDPDEFPCDTLRVLAAVYADHPDFDEAWKP